MTWVIIVVQGILHAWVVCGKQAILPEISSRARSNHDMAMNDVR